jgi:molecular chaperone HscC
MDIYMIGIDLGTTNSLVSFWDGDKSTIIPNSLEENLTPSVISMDDNGDILIGKAAKERLITHPHLTAAFFKRYMGSNKVMTLGKASFRPEELSALVLKSLKTDAENFLQQEVTDAVISVPAYFNDVQRKTTKAAGQIAGLNVKHIINEPTAAAIAYGLHERKEFTTFIVLDLGGGTFDVSILEYFSGVMEVHATAGDTFLGGEDFTDAIVESCLEDNGVQVANLEKNALYALRRQAELCKLELSRKPTSGIIFHSHECHIDWKISRKNFELITSGLVQRMRMPIERAVRDSKLNLKDLDGVILVGGATRMPMIRTMMGKMFGKLPYSTINPDEVVCLGAGIQAGLKTRQRALKEIVLTDVCPHTLGVEIVRCGGSGAIAGGYFLPIIERNSTVPLSRVERVTTHYDNQTKILVEIFQGESRRTQSNIKLSEIQINIPAAPAGEPQIDIRFTCDANGILEVDMDVINTGIRANLVIQENPGIFSEDQIKKCLEKLAKFKIHPRDNMVNRTLLAKGERLYEEALGVKRHRIAALLSSFEGVLDKQNENDITRARRLLERQLNEITKVRIIE